MTSEFCELKERIGDIEYSIDELEDKINSITSEKDLYSFDNAILKLAKRITETKEFDKDFMDYVISWAFKVVLNEPINF